MEDIIIRYIESDVSKYRDICYQQKKDVIDKNCIKNKYLNNCDTLIKLYNDCISFKNKKTKKN